MADPLLAAGWFAGTAGAGPLVLAVPIALLAGAVSFFSPCVLPLVPAYVSYVTGLSGADLASSDRPGARRRGRMLLGAALFVVGFAVVFTLLGAFAGAVGEVLIGQRELLTRLLGVVVIVLGLVFAGVLPFLQRDIRAVHRISSVGLAAAPVLGAAFALGWTPCLGPTLAAVLSLAYTQASPARAAFLLGVYALGLGLPFLLAAMGYRRLLAASAAVRRHPAVVSVVGGVLLILVGLAMVTGGWDHITGWTQGLIGQFGEAAL
jgi:cytochrome c-type biogenesis protein